MKIANILPLFAAFLLFVGGVFDAEAQMRPSAEKWRDTIPENGGMFEFPDDSLPLLGENSGITLSTALAMDVMGAVRGGYSQKAAFLENWHLNLSVDPERFLGLGNSLIYLSTLQNNGGSASTHIGDVQTASNIEALETFRVYELWAQHNMMDNRVSVLAGVYDVNSEFDVMQSAQLFLNSSQGIGAELASSGLVGVSTFPATGLSTRLKMLPYRNVYAQIAVTDGTPGVKNVQWNYGTDGFMAIAEIGYLYKESGGSQRYSSTEDRGDHISRAVTPVYDIKIALGGWGYNRNYASQRYGANIESYKKETGLYLLADAQTLSWVAPELDKTSLHARAGIANDRMSRFQYYFGAGITVKDPLGLDNGGLSGVSVSIAENSSVFEGQLNQDSAPEVAWEFTYEYPATSWLALQPDVQYIVNPGTIDVTDNALVLGFRTTLTL